jgi:hypothetical protein
VTSSLRVYFVKWGQTTHQHVCYVFLSTSTCRTSSGHGWKSAVRKGKTLACHTWDVVFKTWHTQCEIFCMPSPFFSLLTVRTSLCMRIAECYCCSDPTVCCRTPSADCHHLQWYIIGGTWEPHRVDALNLNSNSVLSKGHRPGWWKAIPKDMWHKSNMSAYREKSRPFILEVPGSNLGIMTYVSVTILSIIIGVVYWKWPQISLFKSSPARISFFFHHYA